MSDQPADLKISDDAIGDVLTGMTLNLHAVAAITPEYRALADAGSLTRLVRLLDHQLSMPILNAMDVLKAQHGFTGNAATFQYLFELPARSKSYRASFEAETHVGCYDRTVVKMVDDLVAADEGRKSEHEEMPRAASAALLAHVDERTATELLICATHADDAQRIQRLSTDRWEIARRLADETGLTVEQLAPTVRKILMTAAQIVTEQDREVPVEDQKATRG